MSVRIWGQIKQTLETHSLSKCNFFSFLWTKPFALSSLFLNHTVARQRTTAAPFLRVKSPHSRVRLHSKRASDVTHKSISTLSMETRARLSHKPNSIVTMKTMWLNHSLNQKPYALYVYRADFILSLVLKIMLLYFHGKV